MSDAKKATRAKALNPKNDPHVQRLLDLLDKSDRTQIDLERTCLRREGEYAALIVKLRAGNEADKRDAERLDWIDSNGVSITQNARNDGDNKPFFRLIGDHFWYDSIRNAIDAAIQEGK